MSLAPLASIPMKQLISYAPHVVQVHILMASHVSNVELDNILSLNQLRAKRVQIIST